MGFLEMQGAMSPPSPETESGPAVTGPSADYRAASAEVQRPGGQWPGPVPWSLRTTLSSFMVKRRHSKPPRSSCAEFSERRRACRPHARGIPPWGSVSLSLTAEGPRVSGSFLGLPFHRILRMETQLLDLKALSWGFSKQVRPRKLGNVCPRASCCFWVSFKRPSRPGVDKAPHQALSAHSPGQGSLVQ